MSDIPKVLIAEPIYLGMPPTPYANRIQFWRQVWGEDVPQHLYKANSVVMGPRRNIRSARRLAIDHAWMLKATHIFFMDDDVLVPPNILKRLLSLDVDVAGGLMHKDDGKPIVFKDGNGIEDYWLDHPVDQAFECAGVGAGCMLVKMGVFSKMIAKWPEIHWFYNYDESGVSMDLRFCRMVRSIGSHVWCHPSPPCIQIQHY